MDHRSLHSRLLFAFTSLDIDDGTAYSSDGVNFTGIVPWVTALDLTASQIARLEELDEECLAEFVRLAEIHEVDFFWMQSVAPRIYVYHRPHDSRMTLAVTGAGIPPPSAALESIAERMGAILLERR